jgi:hypothetical protein
MRYRDATYGYRMPGVLSLLLFDGDQIPKAIDTWHREIR